MGVFSEHNSQTRESYTAIFMNIYKYTLLREEILQI